MKAYSVTSLDEAKKENPDLGSIGDRDVFQLLSKSWSKQNKWMKSTKAMEVPGLGCVIQVTTQQGDNVAEALCFVPGCRIVSDVSGGRKLAAVDR